MLGPFRDASGVALTLPRTTPVSCARSSPTLGWRRPQTPPDRPRAPARPRRGHRVTPARGPAGPLTVRSACSSIDGTSARAAVCATHAALDDATCPGSRIAAGAGSEPVGLDSREGPQGRRLDDAGVFQGDLEARCMGRVMRTGVNVAYGPCGAATVLPEPDPVPRPGSPSPRPILAHTLSVAVAERPRVKGAPIKARPSPQDC
jgi:hypothetical protein